MFFVCIHLLIFFIFPPSNTPLASGHNNPLSLQFVLYLLLLDQEMLHRLVFQTIIWIKENGLRMKTRYLCKNMRSMAINACKLQKISAHKHLLKLKSMLNVSSNKIWNQFCSIVMISRVPLSQCESTSLGQKCCWTRKISTISLTWGQSPNFK
jgi:hypothetical protein